jgi:hypothetical protein
MKHAILSDIHANLEALEVVLEKCRERNVEQYICLGDIVGYNANPAECIQIIRDDLACPTVRGNHDHYCSHDDEELGDFQPLAANAISWTRRQLSDEDVRWLKGLPLLRPTGNVEPRIVNGRKRWGNQTDSGQNRLAPSADRWKVRSATYAGIANAMADQWGEE